MKLPGSVEHVLEVSWLGRDDEVGETGIARLSTVEASFDPGDAPIAFFKIDLCSHKKCRCRDQTNSACILSIGSRRGR